MRRIHTVTQELTEWLKSNSPKTIGSLTSAFGRRSFAVAFSLLLILAAVPVPSLGLSNVLAAVSIIFATQLLIGYKTPWLPQWIATRSVPKPIVKKAIPYIKDKLEYIESRSKKRFPELIEHPNTQRFIAGCIIIFSFMSMVAPPFTNLDTPPALAVILLGLGMLLGDLYIALVGLGFGLVGISLFILSFELVKAIFHFL